MKSRRNQIPIGCALNVAIINELSTTESFKKACIEVPLKFNIKPPKTGEPWPFFNISWGSYMMYSLLVVSKEIYNLTNEDTFFKKLVKNDVLKNFIINKEKYPFNENPLYHFKSLRNAISHVNYDINDTHIFLWDHFPGKSDKKDWHWEVEIELNNFMEFLGMINVSNFEFYNEIKQGFRNADGIRK